MKSYMKISLFILFSSFSFSVYGMHQQEAPFKLDEKRLEIVIGNKNNLNKTADELFRLTSKIIKEPKLDLHQTIKILKLIRQVFTDDAMAHLNNDKEEINKKEQSLVNFRKLLHDVLKKIKGRNNLLNRFVALTYYEDNKKIFENLINNFNERNDEGSVEYLKKLTWDVAQYEKINKAAVFKQNVTNYLWSFVVTVEKGLNPGELNKENINKVLEESLSEPLKKMSQDYKTVYKEMAECLLKGALADLAILDNKDNKEKYKTLKQDFSEKIKTLVKGDPYLSRFIKSLQSKLVVEVFLNEDGDGLSVRGEFWKDNLDKVFPPETK